MKRGYLSNGIQVELWGDVFYIPVIVANRQINLRLTSLLGKNPFDWFPRNISGNDAPNNVHFETTVERLEFLYKTLEKIPDTYPYKFCGVEYHEWECKAAWKLR